MAASRQSELDILQEELKGKIRANEHNVREIVEKVAVLQAEMTCLSDQDKD